MQTFFEEKIVSPNFLQFNIHLGINKSDILNIICSDFSSFFYELSSWDTALLKSAVFKWPEMALGSGQCMDHAFSLLLHPWHGSYCVSGRWEGSDILVVPPIKISWVMIVMIASWQCNNPLKQWNSALHLKNECQTLDVPPSIPGPGQITSGCSSSICRKNLKLLNYCDGIAFGSQPAVKIFCSIWN